MPLIMQVSALFNYLFLLADFFLLILQAAERGQYDMAVILVAAIPDLINARDKRDLLALDLVKNVDSRWSVLLRNNS